MARKRSIDPNLWTDDRILKLPWAAVGFYVGLISQADDEGRLKWSSAQLRVRICPAVELDEVESWMAAVVTVGLIEVYESDGGSYGRHPSWSRHQYVNRPTKSVIPPPPRRERSGSPPALFSEVQVPSESVFGIRNRYSESDVAIVYGIPETADFFEVCAAANKTGRITDGRKQSIVLELAEVHARVGRDALVYGLRAAIKKGADTVGYAAAAALNYKPDNRERAKEPDKFNPALLTVMVDGEAKTFKTREEARAAQRGKR